MKPLTPQTPLFTWIVGYAAGCVATLPFLYHRYLHKNQATENGSNSAVTITVGPFRRPSEDENLPTIADDLRNGRNAGPNPPRQYLLFVLECYVVAWFVSLQFFVFLGLWIK